MHGISAARESLGLEQWMDRTMRPALLDPRVNLRLDGFQGLDGRPA